MSRACYFLCYLCLWFVMSSVCLLRVCITQKIGTDTHFPCGSSLFRGSTASNKGVFWHFSLIEFFQILLIRAVLSWNRLDQIMLGFKYRVHMANHMAEKFDCDCPIAFDSRKQKMHHIQVFCQMGSHDWCIFSRGSSFYFEIFDCPLQRNNFLGKIGKGP